MEKKKGVTRMKSSGKLGVVIVFSERGNALQGSITKGLNF